MGYNDADQRSVVCSGSFHAVVKSVRKVQVSVSYELHCDIKQKQGSA